MDDPIYRRLFSFPRMVEDLLRAVVQAPWLDDVDFATLEKLSADHVGDRGQQRAATRCGGCGSETGGCIFSSFLSSSPATTR